VLEGVLGKERVHFCGEEFKRRKSTILIIFSCSRLSCRNCKNDLS
jgi:hypothetical protein